MDKLLLIACITAFFFLTAMMFLTNPSGVGAFGVLVLFILVYILCLGLAVFGCRLFFILKGKLNKATAGNVRKKSYYYGTVIALAPLFLLIGQSFGGLLIYEVVAIFALEGFRFFRKNAGAPPFQFLTRFPRLNRKACKRSGFPLPTALRRRVLPGSRQRYSSHLRRIAAGHPASLHIFRSCRRGSPTF